MSTAIVTHTYLDDRFHYDRVLRWIKYQQRPHMFPDLPIVAIDNGSSKDSLDRLLYLDAFGAGSVIALRQEPKIVRDGLLGYGYTWRTIWALRELLETFDRIIYAESDFFICSKRMRDWAMEQTGWVTVNCPRYRFPESAFFVLTRGCRAYEEFVTAGGWESHLGEVIEESIPWTHVERGFVGDRYREDPKDPPLPATCDFVAQMPLADSLPTFA